MAITILANQEVSQFSDVSQLPQAYTIPEIATGLTQEELDEIALYTVQKINSYPKSFGKTVENYSSILFPDEIKSYLIGREINKKSFSGILMGGY